MHLVQCRCHHNTDLGGVDEDLDEDHGAEAAVDEDEGAFQGASLPDADVAGAARRTFPDCRRAHHRGEEPALEVLLAEAGVHCVSFEGVVVGIHPLVRCREALSQRWQSHSTHSLQEERHQTLLVVACTVAVGVADAVVVVVVVAWWRSLQNSPLCYQKRCPLVQEGLCLAVKRAAGVAAGPGGVHHTVLDMVGAYVGVAHS